MQAVITQIYEIQTPGEADLMIDLGVDHIGSVVLPEHPWKRPVLRDAIRRVNERGAVSCLIPLFSDQETVCRIIAYYGPCIVHFCDMLSDGNVDERIELQQLVKAQFPEMAIMRSIPIVPAESGHRFPSLKLAARLEPVSDWFLTDTLLVDKDAIATDERQPVQGFVGITGNTCDWDIARALVKQSDIPVILAGGLSPENVAPGIRHCRPAGVDSCTLTNAVGADGVPVRFRKDVDRVRRFVTHARSA